MALVISEPSPLHLQGDVIDIAGGRLDFKNRPLDFDLSLAGQVVDLAGHALGSGSLRR